jgi:2-iminobutanoate/2-iminopropanoate deaminase
LEEKCSLKNLGEIIYNKERMSWEKGAEANGFVFLSGVEGIDPSTGACSPEVEVQTRITLDKIKSRLEESGTDMAHVVKYVAYIVGRENVEGYRKARTAWLKENSYSPHHASTLLLVAGLAKPDMLVEIDVIAVVNDR